MTDFAERSTDERLTMLEGRASRHYEKICTLRGERAQLEKALAAQQDQIDELMAWRRSLEMLDQVVHHRLAAVAAAGETITIIPPPKPRWERWISGTGQTLQVHAKDRCDDATACPVHAPTDHPLADRPTHWDGSRGVMQRVCVHGHKHPDPDDRKIIANWALRSHQCDGCCLPTFNKIGNTDPTKRGRDRA